MTAQQGPPADAREGSGQHHLHSLRTWEVERVARFIAPGSRVLEIGAGDGFQAAWLAVRGFRVAAVDVPPTPFAACAAHPVVAYDGTRLPFATGSFDVVFSSNTLEHVTDLSGLLAEVARVLAEGGEGLHVLPTSSWRLAQTLTHPLDLVRRCLAELFPGRATSTAPPFARRASRLRRSLVVLRSDWWPRRHGERGTALTELWLFSRVAWRRTFADRGWTVVACQELGLWYTGHSVAGPALSLRARAVLARLAGSATRLYRVRRSAP
ncbi:MAG: class I SAM-dependent methyltransferase [Thermoanaerobaculaceae bacterium]